MTFRVFSLGCKVNSYECSALSSELLRRGYREAGEGETPDVFILNTCSVTATADQKSRQHIRKFMKLYPETILAVMGCYTQGNADYVEREIGPAILVGTSHRNELPDLIEEYRRERHPIVRVDANPRLFRYEEMGVTSYTENVRAYLKIQDGCDNFCSYCLIPYRRGKMRSRDPEKVVEEARYLVSEGYMEIILTGIHVGGYGKDLSDITFSDLVERLLDIPGLRSLRISSIEESEIDGKLVSLYATRKNLAPHLHIPLQSGSDTVLKRMNRKYDKAAFRKKIAALRDALPHVALTTDVIVGFPGESDEEFRECRDFITECGFHMLHVFPFSAREGTVAYRMKDQVDPRIKSERAAALLSLSKELWNKYTDTFLGRTMDVLVEKHDPKRGVNIGHTGNYIDVMIPLKESHVGDILQVKIEKDMIISK